MWPEQERWRAPVGDFPPRWASAWGDDRYGLWADLTVAGVTQRMRWIEPTGPEGFRMGSDVLEQDKSFTEWASSQPMRNALRRSVLDSESPPHLVVLTKGYWLANTPCTQGFWRALVSNEGTRQDEPDVSLDGLPAVDVSWVDVREKFLFALNNLCANRLVSCFDLPTEAEWEYACRATSTTAYSWGDEFDESKANVDCSERSGIELSGVRAYEPNPWGLYDMHGNVWEWCADDTRWYTDSTMTDPIGHDSGRGTRVIRGGAWVYEPPYARSAARFSVPKDERVGFIGFRFCARSV